MGELPEVPDRPPASDPETVRAVLEEVARLSDAYRSAVVLCELEGRSRSAAARELGIAEGTLSSRLAAARKVLARRFRDRGLVPAVLAAVAGSAACPVLAADVSRLVSASPVPRVEQLSEAVMHGVSLSKWKLAPAAAILAAVGFAVTAAEPPAPANPKFPVAAVKFAAEPKPAPPAAPPPRPDVTAPVAYKDLMLVLVTKDGAAAIVFHDPVEDGAGVSYKFRYESADGKTTKSGDGKVLERRLDGGKGAYDETLLDIKAGPIALRWSKCNLDHGWIYYIPEVMQVHMANAKNFEDYVENFGPHRIERKALDLKRYMRK